ncbi:hypothetical protein K501DRAFT_331256 [Backusella circina FSU 941]|nr:hypothetical protein K501DRAFT_331256 [Backusella circina FSU 941]
MTYTTVSSISNPIFDKMLEQRPSSFLLDYIRDQFEAIISCPPPQNVKEDYFSELYQIRHQQNQTNLPSPPLSVSGQRSIHCNEKSYTLDTPPHTPYFSMPFRDYIEAVVVRSRIDTGTLISTLSYAHRLKNKLSQSSKGMECTHHRIFLATLIITSKYVHDTALNNKYWVTFSQIFSASEINLMERQLLQLLDYNIEIPVEDYNEIVCSLLQAKIVADLSGNHLIDVPK